MRRLLIQTVLPFLFCLVPLLGGALVVVALPFKARQFYFDHLKPLDLLIIVLGCTLFAFQLVLSWRALRWRGPGFDERPDPWLSHLGQAAEWFPLLGLIGTVAGILQAFSGIEGPTPPEKIIALYAPAITATGSGLLMALANILPGWVVVLGRQLIQALGGGEPAREKQ